MTKEEAYDKLELPIGSDLQSIRKKFASMHNDYRMQIDNAFNLTHKHNFEQKLEELKEAYVLLNESEGIDDSSSLPRIGLSYEDSFSKEKHLEDTYMEWSVETALVLFGLTAQSNVFLIEDNIQKYISELRQQFQSATLSTIKDACKQELDKAESAYESLKSWIEERRLFEEQQEQSLEANEEGNKVAFQNNSKKSSSLLIYIIVAVCVVGSVGYYFYSSNTSQVQSKEEGNRDSIAWEAALRGANTQSYAYYLNLYPTGAYASMAKDSIRRMNQINENQGTTQNLGSTSLINKELDGVKNNSEELRKNDGGKETKENNSNWYSKYDDVGDFKEGLAWVRLGKNAGYVNKKGEIIVPIKYLAVLKQYSGVFSEGMVAVLNHDRKYGFVDKNGNEITALKYDIINVFKDGMAAVEINGKWGYVNRNGVEIIPLKYDDVGYFSEGFGEVKQNGKWGFVNKSGEVIIPIKYDAVRGYNNGRAVVILNKKSGMINKEGNVIIPYNYDYLDSFVYYGLLRIKVDNKLGFINEKGEIVIPIQYEYATNFQNGNAEVKQNGKSFFINTKGEYIRDAD